MSPASESFDVVAIIQARMSSSRLPGKVLAPLGPVTVLDHVIDRAAQCSRQVVVCTSTDATDDAVAEHCERRGTLCVRGSLENVFQRFRQVLADERVVPTTWFFRVTADCPLLSVPLARMLLEQATDQDDYLCWKLGVVPRGLPAELVRRTTFEGLAEARLDGPAKEHVTLFLYENPREHGVRWLDPPEPWARPDVRLTLDYPEDYALLQRLFDDDTGVTAESALARLAEKPEWLALNAERSQKQAR